MRRKGIALFVSLLAVVSMVMLPNGLATDAAPSPCADIKFTIDYIDPGTSNPVTLFDDSSAKFGVPVGVPLTFTIYPNYPALNGKQVKFNSPNQFLQLNTASISDGGTAKFNLPQQRPNVNWVITWPTGDTNADNVLTFQATIHPDNLLFGTPDQKKGALLTVGAQVQGGKCGAKIEIYGIPAPPPPGPDVCPGILVAMEYEFTDGNFYPVHPIVQGPGNTQYAGPGVGFRVRYTITTPASPSLFVIPLKQEDRFNRQTILSAVTVPVGPVVTINNAGPVRKVTFNPWKGETKIIVTRALTQGLDTVLNLSFNANGTVNNLCSTHRELRIAAAPLPPITE
jgi:hypothetical protein